MKDNEIHAMRHSLAHVLAAAATRLWPEIKLGIGPVIENGFYYDIDSGEAHISEDHFKKIEKEMRKIINEDLPFEHFTMTIDEAVKWAKDSGQTYKLELLNDLKRDGTTSVSDIDPEQLGIASEDAALSEVEFYRCGDFVDLCRGPHVASTGKVGAFKIMRIAGAYWRGKEDNPQLQRIYGVGFETKDELKEHLEMLEEAKKRDHRKLGKEQDLFMFSETVGSGLPLWLEAGATIRRELERFIVDEEIARGYTHVITPDVASISLYEKSGHYPYYKDSMYAPIDIDGDQYMLRPMTCPHHFEIYTQKPRSYRELPMRIAELAKLYRYEQSGELSGLMRVRSFTLADSHIICTPDQAAGEVAGALELIEHIAGVFGLNRGDDYRYRLSLGDRSDDSKYFKDDAAWNDAESKLRTVLSERGDDFFEAEAEAAFYGPKIDVQMKNVLGKEETAFTVQYDFVMPKRFGLRYIDEHNEENEAVVVHRSSIGAIERVMAFLIEHFAGKFPVWLAPEQIRVLTVSADDKQMLEYAREIKEKGQKLGLRVGLDLEAESVGKKIRASVLDKVPYTVVVGEQEVDSGLLKPRIRDDLSVSGREPELKVDNFLQSVANEASSRTLRSSL
ncbi:MAG: threonine--tRNA ligase [Patescibacteria group bacterium]